MNKISRNYQLDFLKGIACIGVILIHVTFPGYIGAVLSKLSSFAVPAFFMISGYYAHDESGFAVSKMKRRAIKIFIIFVCAMLLYTPYRMYRMYELQQLQEWIENTLSFGTFIKAVVLNDFNFIGAGHLWFLPALLYTYVFIIGVDKLNLYNIIYRVLPVLFVLRILGCMGIFEIGTGMFMFSAVPFFCVGNYLAQRKEIIWKYSNTSLGLAIIASMFWICGCYALDMKYNPAELGVVIYSISIFILALKNPEKSINKKIELLGREYSLFIYVIHILILSRLNICINEWGIAELMWVRWILPIVVIFLSIIVAAVLNNIKIKWQNKMNKTRIEV